MIEAQRLGKDYGPFVAVRDVSFTIPRGQVVALLGPNGAGKTTLMRLLTGYQAASAGSSRVAGFDVRHERLNAAAATGYLPENGPVYGDMTPRETLRFFARARGLSKADVASRLDDTARRCDITAILDKPLSRLSKGLRQRVGLAQALIHDPAVLILDEPTAGLDPNQIRDFRALVRDLGDEKTVLISTHILREVEAMAPRVILLHRGEIAFDGATTDLLEDGSLETSFHRLTLDDPTPAAAHR